jgi:hypothetical protein
MCILQSADLEVELEVLLRKENARRHAVTFFQKYPPLEVPTRPTSTYAMFPADIHSDNSEIKRLDCPLKHIGQTGKILNISCNDHFRAFRNNKSHTKHRMNAWNHNGY